MISGERVENKRLRFGDVEPLVIRINTMYYDLFLQTLRLWDIGKHHCNPNKVK